jgi:hypothetical protein
MNESEIFRARNNRFQNSLQSAVAQFRNGEEQAGLDDFFDCLDDLDCIIDFGKGGELPDMRRMLEAMRKLLSCIENRDAAGLVDALEFAVFPLAKEWGGEREEK